MKVLRGMFSGLCFGLLLLLSISVLFMFVFLCASLGPLKGIPIAVLTIATIAGGIQGWAEP